MRLVACIELADLHEPQIALVHEHTGIEQCDLGDPSQTLMCEISELMVGEDNDLVDGAGFAVACGRQQSRELSHTTSLQLLAPTSNSADVAAFFGWFRSDYRG